MVIIDDDAALLRSLDLIFTGRGYRVTTFEDPVRARKELGMMDTPPDVLLIDYAMPELTGEEFLKTLKGSLPATCTVILISGHTDMIEPLDLGNMGVTAFLPKPLDLDALTALVAERH